MTASASDITVRNKVRLLNFIPRRLRAQIGEELVTFDIKSWLRTQLLQLFKKGYISWVTMLNV